MSRKIRLSFLLTTLLFCNMMTTGAIKAFAQVPDVPRSFEKMVTQTPVAQPSPGVSSTSNKVTKDDITWNFDKDYTVGQFVTGDWYVVAPSGMQVASITASGGESLGGSMKNPAPSSSQGYMTVGDAKYNAALDVGKSLPISLSPGDKLVSTTKYAYYGITSPANQKNYTGIEQAAILTVLSTVPASGSFRPGLSDLNNVIYNKANINYSLLKKLIPIGNVPNLVSVGNSVTRPWLDHYKGWAGRQLHPNYNMRDYGGELTADISIAALMVNCDYTNEQKEPIVIGLIQMGIDFYSNIKRVNQFYDHQPGHINGRKFPVIFAGNMLNIAEIKAIWPKTGAYLHETWGSYPGDAYVFAEDSMHAYVTSRDVTATAGTAAQYQPDYDYSSDMIGMPEWFHQTYIFRSKGSSSWSTDPYRFLSSDAMEGVAIAVYAMGWKSQWNNPAFFDYLDRYVAIAKGQPDPFGYKVPGEKAGNRGIYGSGWCVSMWDNYRKDY